MSPHRIRVFVVDDHPLIRSGLAGMIDAESDLEGVGEAGSGEEAVGRLPALTPDMVLMDLVMTGMDGIEAVASLHKRMPNTKFLILRSLIGPAAIRRAMSAGASGFLLKTASAHELVTAIRNAHAGRRVLAPEATDALFEASRQSTAGGDLTRRERELLALMARGLNSRRSPRNSRSPCRR